jgi:hypothetical protein
MSLIKVVCIHKVQALCLTQYSWVICTKFTDFEKITRFDKITNCAIKSDAPTPTLQSVSISWLITWKGHNEEFIYHEMSNYQNSCMGFWFPQQTVWNCIETNKLSCINETYLSNINSQQCIYVLATRLRAGRPEFDSRKGYGFFLFAIASKSVLGSTQPPTQ